MGKPTGFKEYSRTEPARDPVAARVKRFREFEHSFSLEEAVTQAARCMDCGIPFCQGDTGCPVENRIPEWADLLYAGNVRQALVNLHSTNNFPEWTGRLCPAPCESACVLELNSRSVSIKGIERKIVDMGFARGWVKPSPPERTSDLLVAIVGSGPAGLACAQQLRRAGHRVIVYEKNRKAGGLLRYGIPDFRLEKSLVDRRIRQMTLEGVVFRTSVEVGVDVPVEDLLRSCHALVLAGGCDMPRDLEVPGRKLSGVHFALELLTAQNRFISGEQPVNSFELRDRRIVIVGGGDTGADCVGTCARHKAATIIQIQIHPAPPPRETSGPSGARASDSWPFAPRFLRTDPSHEEGCTRLWGLGTSGIQRDGPDLLVRAHRGSLRPGPSGRRFYIETNGEVELKADRVFVALGYSRPSPSVMLQRLMGMGLELDERGCVKASFGTAPGSFLTTLPRVFACGDMRRGQSLIVWAISEGRKCAAEVNRWLSSGDSVHAGTASVVRIRNP